MRRRFKISLSQRRNRDRQPAKAQRTSNFSTLLVFKAKNLEHIKITLFKYIWLLEIVIQQKHSAPVILEHFWRSKLPEQH